MGCAFSSLGKEKNDDYCKPPGIPERHPSWPQIDSGSSQISPPLGTKHSAKRPALYMIQNPAARVAAPRSGEGTISGWHKEAQLSQLGVLRARGTPTKNTAITEGSSSLRLVPIDSCQTSGRDRRIPVCALVEVDSAQVRCIVIAHLKEALWAFRRDSNLCTGM